MSKKKELSPVDWVIHQRFPDFKEPNDETTEFLFDLYQELQTIFDDDDEEEKPKCPQIKGRDGDIHTMEIDEDVPELIPFAIIKKSSTFLDYKCPHCQFKSKVALNQFRRSQFSSYECPECKKDFLMKLEFKPDIQIYTEIK